MTSPTSLGPRRRRRELRKADDRRSGSQMLSARRAAHRICPIRFRFSGPGTGGDPVRVCPCHARHLHGERASSAPHRLVDGRLQGRWEGDTLVVDLVDFNDETWFDRAGNFTATRCIWLSVTRRWARSHPLRSDGRGSEECLRNPEDEHDLLPAQGEEPAASEYECYAFDHEFHATP